MSIFELLNLRYEYEEIITTNKFKLPNYNSDINSIIWFINNARRHNGLRNDFDKAMEIAKIISEAANGQNRFKQRRGSN